MFDFLRGRNRKGANGGSGKGSENADANAGSSASSNANADAGADANATPSGTPVFSGRRMDEVLASFLEAPLPDAVEGVMFRVSMAEPNDGSVSNFERFAARLFTEIGATDLRPIAVEHPLELRRLGLTGMFWTSFDPSAMTPEQRACVLSAESALNRLALVAKAAKDAGVDEAADEPSEERYSLWDQDALCSIADEVPARLSSNEHPNNLLTLHNATGARGGNWDVSTRFVRPAVSP